MLMAIRLLAARPEFKQAKTTTVYVCSLLTESARYRALFSKLLLLNS